MKRQHRPVNSRLRLEALENRTNPVANDMFADAEVLTGQTAYTFGSNYDFFGTGEPFTAESGEPDHAGVSDPIQSAWYRWTAPISGRAYISSLDFGFTGVGVAAAVYTGTAVDALTELASATGPFDASLTFDAVAGTTYSIAIDSPGDALIEFDVLVAVYEVPANDNFEDAFVLSGAPAPVTTAPATSLSGSSVEVGEPNHAAGLDFGVGDELTLGPSVWYSWTAPTTGQVTLDLHVDYDFGNTFIFATAGVMAVYTGESVDDLTPVDSYGYFFGPEFNDEIWLWFDVTAGTTYKFAVAGSQLFPSTVDLKILNHEVPGATVIDGNLFVVGSVGDDSFKVTPIGTADDGSTGVKVKGNFDGHLRTDTLAQPILDADFFLTDGHDTAELAGSLAFHVEADMGDGNDTFRGGRGDTVVWAGNGNNSVRTGMGSDRVAAGKGNNTITTGGGDDAVAVDIPDDLVPDETPPGTGVNVIDTGDGNDRVRIRSDGAGIVTTGAGNDRVVMIGYGNDVIRTGDGNDMVDADAGSNAIWTGAGNDTITAGRTSLPPDDGVNFVDAGEGNDRVSMSSNGPGVVLAGPGNDDVTVGFRLPVGGVPQPYLTGPAIVLGGEGDDVIIGGGGNDLLDGGPGRDILVGGLGADLLLGGAESDVLFDGTVRVAGGNPFAPPNLRPVFAAWNPADPVTYATIRSKLVVTPDTASRDLLFGGADTDWFWSNDPLDFLDLTPVEVKN